MIYGRLRPSYGHRNVGPGDQQDALEFLSIIVYSFFLYFKPSIIDSFVYFSLDELAVIEMEELVDCVEEEG